MCKFELKVRRVWHLTVSTERGCTAGKPPMQVTCSTRSCRPFSFPDPNAHRITDDGALVKPVSFDRLALFYMVYTVYVPAVCLFNGRVDGKMSQGHQSLLMNKGLL